MVLLEKDTDLPPLYEGQTSHLPPTFPVGKQNTVPVVNVEDLEAHLTVLGAFSKLKENVHHMTGGLDIDKDQAWVVYINRAVHRFNTFMGTEWPNGFQGWTEETTPPLDVLMVLHSYMLVRELHQWNGS
jgi:hypothetical protein